MYSTGDIVNNIIITLYSDRWFLDGDHTVRHINVGSLCCTPETNVILYVNYNFFKMRTLALRVRNNSWV